MPLPGAIDADQKNNALVVEAAGGGWIVEQATLSPLSLANRLTSLFGDPARLSGRGGSGQVSGATSAVEQLADLAEALAGRGKTK